MSNGISIVLGQIEYIVSHTVGRYMYRHDKSGDGVISRLQSCIKISTESGELVIQDPLLLSISVIIQIRL